MVGLEIEAGSIAAAEVTGNNGSSSARGHRNPAARARCLPRRRGGRSGCGRRCAQVPVRRQQALQAGAARSREPARGRPHHAFAGDRGPQGDGGGRSLSGRGADTDAPGPGDPRAPGGRRGSRRGGLDSPGRCRRRRRPPRHDRVLRRAASACRPAAGRGRSLRLRHDPRPGRCRCRRRR